MVGRAQVVDADQPGARFVHGAEADYIGQVGDALGQVLKGSDVMRLQEVLQRLALALALRREAIAAEEQSKHSLRREAIVIARPHQLRETVQALLMQQGGAGGFEVVDLQPDHVEGPGGRAIATAEAAPDILVRVDEEVNVVPVRLFDEGFNIVQIGFVVAAGRFVFQRLPCHHQPQKVQTPVFEPQEVLIGFFQRDEDAPRKRRPGARPGFPAGGYNRAARPGPCCRRSG